MRKLPSLPLSAAISLVLAGIGVALFLSHAAVPHILHVTVQPDGRDAIPSSLPVVLKEEDGASVVITAKIYLPVVHPSVFRIVPDDCVELLSVNDVVVDDPEIPFCDYDKGRAFDLSSLLAPGANEFIFRLRNDGGSGGLMLRPERTDPVYLFAVIGMLFVVGAPLLWLLSRWAPFKRDWPLLFITGGGIALLFLYMLATPAALRGYDWQGHWEYITYLRDNWSLPPRHGGWEFYQPPLYYIVTLLWVYAGSLSGFLSSAIPFAQFLSFLLTALSLFAIIRTLWLLLPGEQEGWSRRLAVALAAVCPSFVFFAPRINNDVLFAPLSFAALFLLMLFWKHPLTRYWYILCFTLALAILTKSNAVLLIAAAFLLLFFKFSVSWKARLRHAFGGFLLIAAVAGMILVPRSLESNSAPAMLVGNIGNLHSGLLLRNAPENFVTFNPLEMQHHVYNNPFSDEERRQYFWEYLYRSALFGEFQFAQWLMPISRALLLLGIWLLVLVAWGMLVDLRKRFVSALPVHLLTVIAIAGHVAFRIAFPYGSSQDFRYSVILIPLFAYYLVRGIDAFPSILRMAATIVTSAFIILCVVFLVGVSIG